MRAGRPVIAAVVNSVWSAGVGLAVVPVYLRYLGVESYGLIGIFASAQVLLQLLDFGLATTTNREVARHLEAGTLAQLAGFLKTVATVFWCTGVLLALLFAASSSWIANSWLHAKDYSAGELSLIVTLQGLMLAARWPVIFYQSVLLGAHRIAEVSVINIIMTTFSSVGAVLTLVLVSPTLQAFFLWQASAALIYALTVRLVTRRLLPKTSVERFEGKEILRIWRIAAGVSGIAITGVLFTQADKIILSYSLSLSSFGLYALATVAAGGLSLLLTPVFSVIFPRLSALVLRTEEELTAFYRRSTRLLCICLFPIVALGVFFAQDILLLWTHNTRLSDQVAPVLRLLLPAAALNGIMLFPYALQLAIGKSRVLVFLNLGAVAVVTLLAMSWASMDGVVGGASAVLVSSIGYLVVGSTLIHRTAIRHHAVRWLFIDVLCPFLATTVCLGIAFQLVARWATGATALLCGIALSVAFSSISLFVARPSGQSAVSKEGRWPAASA